MIVTLGEIKYGREIDRKQRNNKFIWQACESCGKERWVALRKGIPESYLCQPCGAKRKGINRRTEKNIYWKGGRTRNVYGYIRICLHPGDFFYPMADCRHYVLEHRLIMAKALGRCLQPWEWVHHKNGIKDDNRLGNLEFTTAGNHSVTHNKGYQDGYTKGLQDGRSKQTEELTETIEDLRKEIRLLRWENKSTRETQKC